MIFERLDSHAICQQCGFELWEPIAKSIHTNLGLYNDDRFPGRCILSLGEHRDSLESLPMDTIMGFLRDIQIAMKAIRQANNATRVNVAILGNRETHLHAHLIPRFPEDEQFPDCSPWNDLRPKGKLPREKVECLKKDIFEKIKEIDTRVEKVAAQGDKNEQGELMDRNLSLLASCLVDEY